MLSWCCAGGHDIWQHKHTPTVEYRDQLIASLHVVLVFDNYQDDDAEDDDVVDTHDEASYDSAFADDDAKNALLLIAHESKSN